MTQTNKTKATKQNEWTWTNKDVQFANGKLYFTDGLRTKADEKALRKAYKRVPRARVRIAEYIVVTSTDMRQWVVTEMGKQQGRVPEMDLNSIHKLATMWDKGKCKDRLQRYRLAEKTAPVVDGKPQMDKKLLKQLKIPFYIARGRNPLREWCEAIGWDNVNLTRKFPAKLHGKILQAIVRVDGFKDIVISNPLLAVALIESTMWQNRNSASMGTNLTAKKKWDRQRIVYGGDRLGWLRRQTKKQQWKLLLQMWNESCGWDRGQLDKSDCKRAIKLSRKIASCDLSINSNTLVTFQLLANLTEENDSCAKALRHLPKLSCDFIDQLNQWKHRYEGCQTESLTALDYSYLYKLVIGSRRSISPYSQVQRAWHFLDEGVRIGRMLISHGRRREINMPRFKCLDDIQAWHDELYKEFDEMKNANVQFAPSTYANAEGVTFIDTSHGLKAEGRAMHHCVGSYTRHCESGRSRIYHVEHDGETATLELTGDGYFFGEAKVNDEPAKWRVSQLHGTCNKEPSDDLKRFVADWLVQCQIDNQEDKFRDIRNWFTDEVIKPRRDLSAFEIAKRDLIEEPSHFNHHDHDDLTGLERQKLIDQQQRLLSLHDEALHEPIDVEIPF